MSRFYLYVYLHKSRHFSSLKWRSNRGSERLTVLYWSAFQKVFASLIDVHLNHFPFELSPLRYQHLQIRSDTSQLMSLEILSPQENHNEALFNN